MTVSVETKRRFALATALRGVFMLLAGLYAIIWPSQALTVMVLAGGILLLVDGALGLWSLTFGGGKSGNYWFDVVGNALSLILGLVILLSPLLATIFTVTFLASLVGIAALVVGVTDEEGQLVGIITDGDLRRHIDGLLTHTAGEVMTRDPKSVAPETLAGEALSEMQGRITVLFVVENARPVGILHVHDLGGRDLARPPAERR